MHRHMHTHKNIPINAERNRRFESSSYAGSMSFRVLKTANQG